MKTPLILSASALSIVCSNFALAQDVSGRIMNSAGQPIANAQIKVVNQSQRAQSDDQGYYSLKGLTSGSFELHITAPKYIHINESVKIAESDLKQVNWTLEKSSIETIDVYATPLHSSVIESALPVNVISNDELRTKQSSTLGETLKNELGVHSTYYGPVASSPIIRGLDGPRVLITQNGLDVSDASRVGPDHIVATETSTAEQIEVLRGPATLFYGSGAIGGVVNVVDKRVPRAIEQHIDYSLQHNDVADENEASVNINSGQGNIAFHFDAFWRESNDYKIPGNASNEEEHDDHDEEHDDHGEEHDDHEEESNGRLANSAAKSNGFTIGTSYILDKGFIGFSYGQMDREYDIPGHSHHGHHEEEHEGHEEEDHEEEGHDDNVYGDLEQQRWQVLSEYSLDSDWLTQIKSKLSYTDYQHQEIEGDAVGTLFENKMSEARFDIYHKEFSGWQGAWTLHHKKSDFKAVGAEAFTPPSKTTTTAAAWLVEKHFDQFLWQVGARIEHVDIETDSLFFTEAHDEHHEGEGHEEHDEHENSYQESFTPVSASVGLVWDYQKGYNLGLSASFAQRAPSASEIFSNGPHIGTNTYEVGTLYEVEVHDGEAEIHFEEDAIDNNLETSYSLDLTWRKFSGDLGIIASVFYNQFDNYYYLANTGLFFEEEHGHDDHGDEHDGDHGDEHDGDHGDEHDGEHEEEEEGLPIYHYQQQNLDMYGVELELVYQWSPSLTSTLFTDYTHTELDDGSYLPRMPPLRIGGGLMYQGNGFYAEFNVRHYFEQDNVADLETTTGSYTIIDAHANYYLQGFGDDTVLFLKIDNLADQEARVHTSFLKDDAPLPGRGISFGIRGSF